MVRRGKQGREMCPGTEISFRVFINFRSSIFSSAFCFVRVSASAEMVGVGFVSCFYCCLIIIFFLM